MNDSVTPAADPATPGGQPPKKCCGKKKGVCLIVALIVLGGASAFVYVGPWLLHRQATVNVAGGNEALRAEVESINRRVEALESRVEALSVPAAPQAAAAPAPEAAKPDTATAAGLARMQSDMVALSSAMSALQTEVKLTGMTAAETREVSATLMASIVAFIQLREASSSGRAFADELAVLREASRNDTALQASVARLEPYAAAGVPTLATLHDELLEREPAIAVAVAKGAAQNWWQRVLAELQGLITVRPLHGGEGDALAQLESSLGKSNAAAVEAFKALPADAERSLADWQKKLEARQHVDEGIAAIAARFTTLPAVAVP